MTQRLGGGWLVLAAAVLWGTTGTAQALAPAGATPLAVGAARIVIGAGALLAVALCRRELKGAPRWPRVPVAVAGIAIAVYQLCFFAAVHRTGVAVGTVVAIGSAPVVAGTLGRLLRGEALSGRWAVATGLAVAGGALLIAGHGGLRIDSAGITLAVGAGAAYAVYAVAARGLLAARPPAAVMAAVFCTGAILLAPLLPFTGFGWLATPRGAAVALHLGLVATAAAYLLFARGLAAVPVATAASLSLAEPLTAGLLGVAVLGERPGPAALVGAGLLFAGLGVLAVSPAGRDVQGAPGGQ